MQILLADPVNAVKQALMEHSVMKLAIFFGKLKANDVLLSHMITFLNDKEDAQLRDSFYENIVGVAAFVGWQCSPILLPLLQQGLSDPEEFVIARCIGTISYLTTLELLQKVALYDLLKETAPFLIHPNLWIRQATAGFISAAAAKIDPIDVVVKLGTIISPFLQKEVIELKKPYLIMNGVQPPIPRKVYENIVKISATSTGSMGNVSTIASSRERNWEKKSAPEILADFLDFLEERRTWYTAKQKHGLGASAVPPEVPSHLAHLYRRLEQEDMTPEVEKKVLYLRDHLEKTARQRAAQRKTGSHDMNQTNNIIELSRVNTTNGEPVETRKETLDVEFASIPSTSSSTASLAAIEQDSTAKQLHQFGGQSAETSPKNSRENRQKNVSASQHSSLAKALTCK